MKLSEIGIKQRITPCKAACCISIERTGEKTYNLIDSAGCCISVTKDELTVFAEWLKESI